MSNKSPSVFLPHSKKRSRKSIVAVKHVSYMSLLSGAVEELQYELSEQRIRVIHGLCALEYLDNAEELWLLLNEKKKISRAVVYSCLNILCRSGLLIKIDNEKGAASYRLNKKKLSSCG